MFTINDRNFLYDFVIHLAKKDNRVIAGALVGSLAFDGGDQWSDVDLTFSVEDGFSILDVLEDWTAIFLSELNSAHLFDVQRGPTIYRVFLLPSCLQCDLSFTPKSQFGPAGPKFKLLFGEYMKKSFPSPPSATELFGYAVHHVLRARLCIERERYWQAEFWISSTRDYILHLACLRRGLPADHGRGFDNLPSNILVLFKDSLISSLNRDELMRALTCVVNGLLNDLEGVEPLANKVKPQLYELISEWNRY
ncbi:MAG: hypothetical protein JNM55_02005 [Anaerolineales bacterium]|nr:hypothetical protein [Anaerolineales bacterium]